MVQEKPAALEALQNKMTEMAKAKEKSSMFERALRTRPAYSFELKVKFDDVDTLPPGRHEAGQYGLERTIIVNENGTGMIEKLSHHLNKEEALSLLESVGITKLSISFYGGHDEGCENGATATINGTEVEGVDTEDLMFGDASIRYSNHHYGNRDGDKEEWKIAAAQLCENLGSPIWSKYGSFAGDFNVDGKLVYDVEKGTIVLDGQVSSYEPFLDTFVVDSTSAYGI